MVGKMIVFVDANCDERGYWTHPALARSGCETIEEFRCGLRTHRLQYCVMTMRDEAPDVFAAVCNEKEPDARGWVPEPPDDDDWFLGAVHKSSYGPACYWFRNVTMT